MDYFVLKFTKYLEILDYNLKKKEYQEIRMYIINDTHFTFYINFYFKISIINDQSQLLSNKKIK